MDAVTRLARVDLGLLQRVSDYLDQAGTILEMSEAAATQAIRQRAGQSGATEATRAAIDSLLRTCEPML